MQKKEGWTDEKIKDEDMTSTSTVNDAELGKDVPFKMNWWLFGFLLFVLVVFFVGFWTGMESNPKTALYEHYAPLIEQFRQCASPQVFCP